MSKTVDKVRSWSCITYLPEYLLVRRIDSMIALGNLLHYAYIIHDCDILPDGTPDEPHIHICLYFRNPLRFSSDYIQYFLTSSNPLDNAGNCRIEPLSDRYSMVYEYFIHKNEPDKFQYSFDRVVADDFEFWSQNGHSSEDIAVIIVERMLAGVPYIDLVREFGRNFVYHYSAFKKLVEDIKFQEYKNS